MRGGPMADKKKNFSTSVAGNSWVSGSIGAFFKQLNWEIISFFPNSSCVCNKQNSQNK